jgi:hypothetical protein
MAVVEDRIVGTVGFLDLIERLDDQEARTHVGGPDRLATAPRALITSGSSSLAQFPFSLPRRRLPSLAGPYRTSTGSESSSVAGVADSMEVD